MGIVLVAGGAILHLVRQRGVPPWNSLWAEDGSVFLSDAMHDFAGTFFAENGGYGHVVPRIIAGAAAALPVEDAAAGMAAAASVVVALIAGFVYFASGEVLPSRMARFGLAAAVLLLPVPGSDLLANATNLHFYLLFGCFWALFWQSETPAALGARSAVGLAATLSDPLAALFMPLALVAPLARRRVRAFMVSGVFVAGLATQLLVTWGGERPHRNWGFRPADLLDIFSLRVTGGLLVGDRFLGDAWLAYGRTFSYTAFLLVAAIIALLLTRSSRATVAFVFIALGYGCLFFCVQLVGRGTGGTDPDLGVFQLNGARYVLLPFLFTTAGILALVDRNVRLRRGAAWAWTRRVALVWLAALLIVNYSVTSDRSRGPRWDTELMRARNSCATRSATVVRVLVAPSPPRVWFASVPCSRLGDGVDATRSGRIAEGRKRHSRLSSRRPGGLL
jgi:hypothetical protein